MEYSLFEEIIERAASDCAKRQEPILVSLYNWGEALIHPRIADFVSLLATRKIPFEISTNFNNEIPLRPIVRSRPNSFRISLSGFSNEVYQKGHVRGDVNLVISNMYRLRYTMDRCNSDMPVQVYYHVYNDNCGDDVARMANLCDYLGFRFWPGWAYFMGIEKILAHVEGAPKFSDQDRVTLGRTVLTLDEAIEVAKQAASPSCHLQTGQTVINHDGSVSLCCTVYDPINRIASDFRALSREEVENQKRNHPLCSKCMSHGLHDYAMYNPSDLWDSMAMQKQIERGQRYITSMFSLPHIRERTQGKRTAVDVIRDGIGTLRHRKRQNHSA